MSGIEIAGRGRVEKTTRTTAEDLEGFFEVVTWFHGWTRPGHS